jgi:hypothetical protein
MMMDETVKKPEMIINSIFIFAAILITAGPAVAIGSSDNKPEETQTYVGGDSAFYREDGHPRDTKNRTAINPDFAPDRSCDLKWELKCIPGSEQQCNDLRGYDNGEMNVCTPIGCPEGYHNNFEWEDNVCYSNEEVDCQDDYILLKGPYGDTCEPPSACEQPENRDQDPCIEYCDENSDNSACDPEKRAEKDTIRDMSCDGALKPYLEDLPKLDEDECYGTCEMPNRQLECDIEKR